ncbi:MAG: NUDIX domain-containing protein [Bdellovibrionota bacterium]
MEKPTENNNSAVQKVREITVVAAALLRPSPAVPQDEKPRWELFIARRAPHDQGAGIWEFPGGKVERGESNEEALVREILEELSVSIQIEKYLGQNDYFLTKEVLMHLHVYAALPRSQNMVLVDHDACEWHSLDTFPTEKISAADQPFVAVLRTLILDVK